MEGAKIHAENSIRQKNQALNYRRMGARIDAVAARVQTALTMKQVKDTIICLHQHNTYTIVINQYYLDIMVINAILLGLYIT